MAKKETMPDEFLEVHDVCRLYHVTRRTIYTWIHDGKLTGRKVGRKWLFTRDEVESLMR